MVKRKSRGGSGSDRSYVGDAVKAAAHPTRKAILKELDNAEEKTLTTVQLEQATGENRYRLYHHLDVLEEAGLVESDVIGKAKQYSIPEMTGKIDTAYLELAREDPTEREDLQALLKLVRKITGDRIPNLDKVVRARLLLSYPWSEDEDNSSAGKPGRRQS